MAFRNPWAPQNRQSGQNPYHEQTDNNRFRSQPQPANSRPEIRLREQYVNRWSPPVNRPEPTERPSWRPPTRNEPPPPWMKDNRGPSYREPGVFRPPVPGPPGDIFFPRGPGRPDSPIGTTPSIYNIHSNQTNLLGNNTLNGTLCGDPVVEFSDQFYLYGVAFLVLLAVLFNCLAIGVFRTKALRQFAFSTYFTAIAVADLMSLGIQIPRKWLDVLFTAADINNGTTIYDTNDVACKTFTYFSYLFRFASAWFTVCMASERLVVAKDPHRRNRMRWPKTAYQLIFGVLALAAVLNCHVLITWASSQVEEGGEWVCSPSNSPSVEVTFALIGLTILAIVGLPFIIVCTTAITTIKRLNSDAWDVKTRNGRRVNTKLAAKMSLERKATIMVSIVEVVFSLFSLPHLVAWIVSLKQHMSADVSLCQSLVTAAYVDITEVIFLANYAIKFAFCVLFGTDLLSIK